MQVNNAFDVAMHLAAEPFVSIDLAALGATTDLGETIVQTRGPAAGASIGLIRITANAGLTSSDTLFRTITVAKRTAGVSTTLATLTTKTSGSGGSGDWTAWIPVSIPITVASIAPNDIVTLAIAHASTGTAIPSSMFEMFLAVQ